MKKQIDKSIVQITDPQIEKYALDMTTKESEAVTKLVQSSDEALEFIDMLSGNMVSHLLKMLVKISGAKRILELGTFTGYSALTMAEALPNDGELVTIEMNIRYQDLAEKHFAKYDKENKIQLIKGDAKEVLEDLEGDFDLVFIDADKAGYDFYYEKSLSMVRQGGIIVVDNVLWDGAVLHPRDDKAGALHKFNEKVAYDDRVEQVLLTVRDGVTLIRKK
ncbi:O-methyltransferase [Gracilimonas sp.]|uniref:O-methyltransferase n=1 Tax=Gracilimonas sp. TaxID=1974203 RepID=UPI002870D6D9|nr:O-methyltransferase [Gracilimonas sp.]